MEEVRSHIASAILWTLVEIKTNGRDQDKCNELKLSTRANQRA